MLSRRGVRDYLRIPCNAPLTAWSKHAAPRLPGRVLDVSASGLALDVDGELAPKHGEVVHVWLSETLPPSPFRVVRIHQAPDGRAHLGCRAVSQRAR